MPGKNASECISRILRDIERLRNVDFGDKNSLWRYNSAMRRIAENAACIDSSFPGELDLFVALCEHPDPFVVDRCARRVFELDHVTMEHQRRALNALFRRLEDPDLIGERAFWITDALICAIQSDFPEELDRFAMQLENRNNRVAHWCASRILNSCFPGREVKLLALNKLRNLNQDPGYPEIYKIYLPAELARWESELL